MGGRSRLLHPTRIDNTPAKRRRCQMKGTPMMSLPLLISPLCSIRSGLAFGVGVGSLVLSVSALWAGEVEHDWSGRFLGSIAAPPQMALQPPMALIESGDMPSTAAEPRAFPQHQASGTPGGGSNLWQGGARRSPAAERQVHTTPPFRSGLQIVQPRIGAAGLAPGALGLGWGVEVSSQVYLRGSVFGREDGEGGYSLSPENRQLALTASFRF